MFLRERALFTSQILHPFGGVDRGMSNCVPHVTQIARSADGGVILGLGIRDVWLN